MIEPLNEKHDKTAWSIMTKINEIIDYLNEQEKNRDKAREVLNDRLTGEEIIKIKSAISKGFDTELTPEASDPFKTTPMNRWISVDTAMPPEGEIVIVFCDVEIGACPYSMAKHLDGRWTWGHPNAAPVTHWMPLPDPPFDDER